MAKQTFKMYMVVGAGRYNHGEISLQAWEPSDDPSDAFSKRVIKEVECEFDVPEFDLRLMEIEALEACVKKERADSQVRVNLLLDRISKLQAITHEVDE